MQIKRKGRLLMLFRCFHPMRGDRDHYSDTKGNPNYQEYIIEIVTDKHLFSLPETVTVRTALTLIFCCPYYIFEACKSDGVD